MWAKTWPVEEVSEVRSTKECPIEIHCLFSKRDISWLRHVSDGEGQNDGCLFDSLETRPKRLPYRDRVVLCRVAIWGVGSKKTKRNATFLGGPPVLTHIQLHTYPPSHAAWQRQLDLPGTLQAPSLGSKAKKASRLEFFLRVAICGWRMFLLGFPLLRGPPKKSRHLPTVQLDSEPGASAWRRGLGDSKLR